jgi:hypothetical protein
MRHPASLVRILDASFLVHELWIVNRGSTPATLTSVMVLDGVRTIVRYTDDDLRADVGRPDLPRNHPTPLVLAPEHAAVVYFWSALPGTPTTGDQITHRVVLSSGQPTDSQDVVVEGGASTITPLADAVVIDSPLRGAGWAAVNEPAMIGGHRTAVYTIDGVARIPGRFAIDFMRVLTTGRAHTDAANRPDDWNGFGAVRSSPVSVVPAACRLDRTCTSTSATRRRCWAPKACRSCCAIFRRAGRSHQFRRSQKASASSNVIRASRRDVRSNGRRQMRSLIFSRTAGALGPPEAGADSAARADPSHKSFRVRYGA